MNDNIAKAISLFISGVTQSMGQEIVIDETEVKKYMETAQHKVGLLMHLVDTVSSSEYFRELVDSIEIDEIKQDQVATGDTEITESVKPRILDLD